LACPPFLECAISFFADINPNVFPGWPLFLSGARRQVAFSQIHGSGSGNKTAETNPPIL
jgi:hypothetical protein